MTLENNTIFLASVVLITCFQTFVICSQYQTLTGIDLLDALAQTQAPVQDITREVFLSDTDLWELLRHVTEQASPTNVISGELLESLGLYTNSVISYLNLFGYIIN